MRNKKLMRVFFGDPKLISILHPTGKLQIHFFGFLIMGRHSKDELRYKNVDVMPRLL
jgi:hypothetical protein